MGTGTNHSEYVLRSQIQISKQNRTTMKPKQVTTMLQVLADYQSVNKLILQPSCISFLISSH